MTLRDQTLLREQAAEIDFLKSRCLQLSEAVTELSGRLAEAEAEEEPEASVVTETTDAG
ncbi:hypothetical protein [Pseudorhodobacter sp.]|uniref:hypothetical protein n=1 Tax=Pseudorhodobacter sp. TaxID=1934400 RepID=UPI002649B7D1|nr:hypothetical protein [Pseudorhodobacter sp.]MDN5789223.1 hypothetical protein [Pseudorhodobacter sp.]